MFISSKDTCAIILLSLALSASGLPLQDATPNSNQVTTQQKNGRQLDVDFGSYLLVSPLSPFDYSNVNPMRQQFDGKPNEEERVDDDVIVTKPNTERGEMMHTAENLVFRPLFSYRKLQEKRKRLHGNTNKYQASSDTQNALRRNAYVYPSQASYSYPGYQYSGYPSSGYYYSNGQYYYPYY